MKNNVIAVLLIGLVLLFAGCQSTGAELKSSSSDVYIGGMAQDASGTMSARVWKNDKDYPLNLDGIAVSEVKSVFVDSKGNVYAAGFTQDESDVTFAKVWKNGEVYPVNEKSFPDMFSIYSIGVGSDGAVYAVGFPSDVKGYVSKAGELYPVNLEVTTESYIISVYIVP